MLRFLFKKQRAMENLMEEYITSIESAQEMFLHSMETYFETGECCPDFDFLVTETHKMESRTDDIQEKIVRLLFEKALIPDLRGDILTLLELMDDVPDQFDRVLYTLLTQKVSMPDELEPEFKELVEVSLEASSSMLASVRSLFRPSKAAAGILCRVDHQESRGDHIERRIIVKIFESDWDPLQKILLRDLTAEMGEIADCAVRGCRQVNLIKIKRRV